IYHEKVGIFADEADNKVVFTGSANESTGGLISNFESIDVYRSWVVADQSRIKTRVDDFETLWRDLTPRLRIYDFPEAVRRQLLTFKQPTIPRRDPQEPKVGPRFVDLGVPTLPRTLDLRDYQKEAVR